MWIMVIKIMCLKPSINTSGVGTALVGTAMAGPKCVTFYSNDMIYCFKNNKRPYPALHYSEKG